MSLTKTVLIVDDSRVSRLMARQYIVSMHADWIVEEAGTGEESLVKARATPPDLILMDVNMPGMGGIAAAELLRQEFPNLPISLLTANVQSSTRERAAQIGVGFMEKPITEARIAQLVSVLEVA